MAKDLICLDKVSVQRLLTEAIATGEHGALIWIVANLGDEQRPVITLSGQEPDAVDRFLAFCADRQLLSDREILDYAIWGTRTKLRKNHFPKPVSEAELQFQPRI